MFQGMPLALARRSLIAAAGDPDSTLRAMAATGGAALFDALLSQAALHHLPEGRQAVVDPFLLPDHPQTLWGLLALAPPDSTRATALRDHLRAMWISGSPAALRPTSLRYLGRLPALRRLTLEDTLPTEVETLADHPGLERLALLRCGLLSVVSRGLAGAAVTQLHIEEGHALASPVVRLPGLDLIRELSSLHIHLLPALVGLPDLAVHAGLETVSLRGLPALVGVPLLPVGLRRLTLSGLPWTPKALAAALCELSSLTRLEIEGIPLVDLGWLPAAPLEHLVVQSAPTLTDLSGIEVLQTLRWLDLSGCDQLTDLSPLGALEGLEHVDLRGCAQVTDLRPLVGLPALRSIAVAGSGAEQRLPEPLRRRVSRSWVLMPPRRRGGGERRRPPLDATQQAALRTIRALLHSGDTDQVEQALELARALADPRVYASLLRGVHLSTEGDAALPVLQGNRYFAGQGPHRTRLRWALLHTLADAPPGLAEAAVRDHADALLVEGPVLDVASLQAFPALRSLTLQQVKRLDHPAVLSTLAGLTTLSLSMCVLPPGVRLPPGLVDLSIDYLAHPELALLSGGRSLERLKLLGAEGLVGLAGLEGATNLRRLEVGRAARLEGVSALAGLAALEWVSLLGVPMLSSLAGLEGHTRLQGVQLEQAPALTSLHGLRGCAGLEVVQLQHCTRLRSLAGLEDARSLRVLRLQDCDQLRDLAAVRGASLQEVVLEQCRSLRSLAGLSGSRELTRLRLHQVSALTDLWGLEGLSALASLEIDQAARLGSVSALAGLVGLRRLSLRGCPTLSDLSAVGMLPSLETLTLAGVSPHLGLSALDSAPAGLTLRLEAPLALQPLLRQPQVAVVLLSRRHHDLAAVPAGLLSRVRWIA